MVFLTSILRLLVICTNMHTLVHRCEKVYRQNDRIIESIDDLIICRKAKEETVVPLKELRKLISSRPIQFHTGHFFPIDYTLLSAMTSVVVTYTIIYLQNLQT
ncbi:uncharacterized protein LOC113231106 [Hyposmocoma kahamanoa]|uniref:uncharacterized protein LOC113231106 n=1 Tax=Hyposmocoma kahamanoa TaxID=1477025 RepID=UPI000E6D8B21|nr:uncharacterized protein LOC113231106 [Hyposmocoma kahamanoa]